MRYKLIDYHKLNILKEKEQFFQAFLLFISGTGIVSSHVAIICFMLVCLINSKKIGLAIKTKKSSFELIGLIILLSLLNELFHILVAPNEEISPIEVVPYSLFIGLTMLAARLVDERVFKWLIVFSFLDVGAAIFQKIIGIKSFFAVSEVDIAESGLLYDLKVNGLNTNSAGLGTKSFFMLIIYDFFEKTHFIKRRYVIIAAILGAVLAFNRTAMIGLFFYFLLLSLKNRKLILIYVAIGLVVLQLDFVDDIMMQMTRGSMDLSGNSLSGRDDVYGWFWDFVKENPFWGNGSFKLMYRVDDLEFHAHNSYLQTMAANGLIIASLYFVMVLINIKRKILRFILPILLCGFFQALFFWGASYTDFVMWSILLGSVNRYSIRIQNNQKIVNYESIDEEAICHSIETV